MWKLIPTVNGFWKPGCGKDSLTGDVSGTILEHSMLGNGKAELTLFTQGFLAPRSLSQANGSEQTIPVTSGPKSGEPLARFDPASCSWKMSQGWLSGMAPSQHTHGPSSLTLPPWVMWDGQALYRQ